MSAETESCNEIPDLTDLSINENCFVTGSSKDLSKVGGDYIEAVPKVVSVEHGGKGETGRKYNLMEDDDDQDGSYDFRSCIKSVNGVSIDKTLHNEEDPELEDVCLNHDKKVQVQELSLENAEAACQGSKIDYEANLGHVVLSVKPVKDENQTAVIGTAHGETNVVDPDLVQLDSAVNTLPSFDEPGQLEHGEDNLEEPKNLDDYQNSQEFGLKVYLSEEVAKSCPFVLEEQVPVLSSSNVESETSPLSSLSGSHENGDGDEDEALKLKYEMVNSSTSGNGDHLDTGDKRSLYEDHQVVIDGANTANLKIPFNYLIKVPRYDDESLRQQIEQTEQDYEESTRFRDLIKEGIKIIKAKSQELHAIFESAKSEEKLAWDLVKSKRQEIEAVQSVINRVKNAITVDDLDIRIYGMEQMIEHRTLLLKEETYYLREIKQLKTLREWLYSSMGSKEDVQQAFSQNDGAEERLMILRKELNQLKINFEDAEEAAKVAWWKYDDERRKMKGLYVMFTTEDDVCQEEFRHLTNLQNQLRDKNVWFMRYKDEQSFAHDFAASGNEEVFQPLCMNQVSGIMEEWNQNDEFRTIYIRSNVRSTLSRFRTLEDRELGQDEEDNNAMYISVDHSMVSTSTKEVNNSHVLTMRRSSTDSEEQKLLKTETCSEERPKPIIDDESAKTEEMNEEIEEEMVATNEEEEEERMRLKEQERKQEEMVKAKEALKRKRRNVEKAMARAEVWAQKEAEQKEKKKARKKDKKKEFGTEGEEDEDDSREEGEIPKRPMLKAFQFGKKKNSKSKSIPPPSMFRNKGKKRIEQWISAVILILVILVLFLIGNIGIYSNLKSRSFNKNQHYT